jgi:hypothetical protein
MNRRHVIAGTAMAAGTLALPALAQDDIARSNVPLVPKADIKLSLVQIPPTR